MQIFEVTNTDTLIFEGFVSNFVVDDFMTITASEQKALLFSKLVRGDKEYTSEPCNQILQDVINNWNSFSGDNLTLNSNITQNVNKSYKDGDNLYDILASLASETDSKWTMIGREIIFRDIIGTERDFKALYNPLEPTATNIESVRLENY